MPQQTPAPELTAVLGALPPARALDMACGSGRHAAWLTARGWHVTAVDQQPVYPPALQADLEKHEFRIVPDAWDLIVCWLYWQPDLMPEIAAGIRPGGVVAIAGKTSGRFATSLQEFRSALPGWIEMASGQNETRAFLIARRPAEKLIHQ